MDIENLCTIVQCESRKLLFHTYCYEELREDINSDTINFYDLFKTRAGVFYQI